MEEGVTRCVRGCVIGCVNLEGNSGSEIKAVLFLLTIKPYGASLPRPSPAPAACSINHIASV